MDFDKNIRFWKNKKTVIVQIPDRYILERLKDGEIHTYSINANKGTFSIMDYGTHQEIRPCRVIYDNGSFTDYDKENIKPRGKKSE